MENKSNIRLGLVLAVFWLVLTSSLALWWMIFAMQLIAKIETDLERHRSMLFWEGATLLTLLLVGGSTLIYFILRERRQAQSLKEFFAGFTHDVKTRLAGVKLQTESLKADNKDTHLKPLIDRLITDTSRLQVQVENSLFIGGSQKSDLYVETVVLSDLFRFLRDSWPQIEINLKNDAKIKVDRRVFENIITNILHNAISHGQATRLDVSCTSNKNAFVYLNFVDNGQGFSGDPARLGEIFYRHNPSSGSGLGLYTAREYLKRMGGQASFETKTKGFSIALEVPGELQ
jgi:signal transduction histidine kinase